MNGSYDGAGAPWRRFLCGPRAGRLHSSELSSARRAKDRVRRDTGEERLQKAESMRVDQRTVR
jgi:hypothetical protein